MVSITVLQIPRLLFLVRFGSGGDHSFRGCKCRGQSVIVALLTRLVHLSWTLFGEFLDKVLIILLQIQGCCIW